MSGKRNFHNQEPKGMSDSLTLFVNLIGGFDQDIAVTSIN